MHLTAFRVLYFVAACGSSKFGFYCGFLFNLPHNISQSKRKRKYEFVHELLKALLHKFHMHKAADVIAYFSL